MFALQQRRARLLVQARRCGWLYRVSDRAQVNRGPHAAFIYIYLGRRPRNGASGRPGLITCVSRVRATHGAGRYLYGDYRIAIGSPGRLMDELAVVLVKTGGAAGHQVTILAVDCHCHSFAGLAPADLALLIVLFVQAHHLAPELTLSSRT